MKKVLSTLALMACIMMALPAQAQLKFGYYSCYRRRY